MSSDHAALLAAVLASPDDDTPRLVYADFLDDTGDPADADRAEFIRLEVEADRLPEGAGEKVDIERRTAVLLRRHLDAWYRELPGWLGRDARVFYRRGFPFELDCDYQRFAASAAELFDVTPIQAVRLRPGAQSMDYGFDWTAVVRPAFLARVRRLALAPYTTRWRGMYTAPSAITICRAAGLCDLRALDLSSGGVWDEWVTDFVREFPNAHFADTLDELLLSDNAIHDGGALALAAAPKVGRLKRLDLRNNRISPAGWGPLAARFGSRLVV